MPLNVVFGGALVRYKPADATGSAVSLPDVEGLTLPEVLTRMEIPEDQPMMIILNGNIVTPENRAQTVVNDNDNLSLMSPIQAG